VSDPPEKHPDIAELGARGELGDSPEDGGRVVEMFPRPRRRQPGEDDDLEEYQAPSEHEWLRRDLIAAAEQGDAAEAERLAAELRRRTAIVEPIPWIGWTDIMADLEPLDWVVEGLEIAAGPPTMVAGYGYSGKTISLQSMIVSVAAGKPVWGAIDVQPGPVAHIDGEQGQRLCRDRYQRLARSMGASLEHLEMSGDMRLVCYPTAKLAEESEASWRRLFEGRRLVLIDSLRALLPPGVDENSSAVRSHLDMLARISEDELCAIVILHHMRKAGQDGRGDVVRERIRGSSGLFDAVQSCLAFVGDKGEPPVVHHEKARITGSLRESFALEISDERDPDDESGCRCGGCESCRWGVRVRQTAVEDVTAQREQDKRAALEGAVKAFIRDNPDCCGKEIRAGVRGRNQEIDAALAKLKRLEQIADLNEHTRGSPGKWRVKWEQ
jgi:hypothetical protein